MRSFAILMLGLLLAPHPQADSPHETAAVVEELGLRAAQQPISEHPGWQPRRLLVSLPRIFLASMPGLEEQLRGVAGDVEVRIGYSGNPVPNLEQLAGTDAFIGLCSPAIVANADSLLWLHSISAGMDSCAELGDAVIERTVFTNSKRVYGPTIAEHAIAMMLSLARGLPSYWRAQKKRVWGRGVAASASRFGEVGGKTMLVVGLGGIGTQIAERAHGLHMRVIATRNSSRNGPDFVDYVGLADELHKLAGEADVVVNALPLTASTDALFDRQFFAAAKRGSIFISIGRGKSTVTADLIDALESGQLYAVGLDVTDPEPLHASSPLWQMENVIITPHVSAITRESMQRAAIVAVENFRRYVAGEALLNIVDLRKGY